MLQNEAETTQTPSQLRRFALCKRDTEEERSANDSPLYSNAGFYFTGQLFSDRQTNTIVTYYMYVVQQPTHTLQLI